MVKRARIFIVAQAFLIIVCLSFVRYRITSIEAQEQQLVPIASLEADEEAFFRLAWNPSSTTLAIATAYDEVQLYDTNLELVGKLEGHTDDVFDVAWSPDGTLIASTSLDDTMRLWDVASQEAIAAMNLPGAWKVNWNSNGQRLAIIALDMSRDPYYDYSWTNVSIWNVSNPSAPVIEHTLPPMIGVSAVDWSLDNSTLIVANNVNVESNFTFWNATTGQLELERFFSGPAYKIADFARRPNSNVLVIAPNGIDVVEVYNPANEHFPLHFRGHETSHILAVDWNPTGQRLVSSDEDGVIKVWDVATAQALATLSEPLAVYEVEWSPDDRYIASISGDRIVHIWDVSTLSAPIGIPTATYSPLRDENGIPIPVTPGQPTPAQRD